MNVQYLKATINGVDLPLDLEQDWDAVLSAGQPVLGARGDNVDGWSAASAQVRQVALRILIDEGDKLTTHQMFEGINKELARGGDLVLELWEETASTVLATSTFEFGPSDGMRFPADRLWRTQAKIRTTAIVTVKPYALAEEASATTGSQPIDFPYAVELDSLDTVYSTPLTVLADDGWGIHSLYVGLCPSVDALFPFVVEAESGLSDELVLDGSPNGSTWPATWNRAVGTEAYLHAADSKFHVEDDAGAFGYVMSIHTNIPASEGQIFRAAVTAECLALAGAGASVGAYVEWLGAGEADFICQLSSVTAEAEHVAVLTAPAGTTAARVQMNWNFLATGPCAATFRDISLRLAADEWAADEWAAKAVERPYCTPDGELNSTLVEPGDSELAKAVHTEDFPPGVYRVLARVFGPVDISHDFCEPTYHGVDSKPIWSDLGDVVLPVAKVTGGEHADLTFLASYHDGGAGDGWIDRLAFVPVSWGFFAYHPTSAAAYANSIRAGWDAPYIDDRVNWESVEGGSLKAREGVLMVVAESPYGTDERVKTMQLDVLYRGRWSIFSVPPVS